MFLLRNLSSGLLTEHKALDIVDGAQTLKACVSNHRSRRGGNPNTVEVASPGVGMVIVDRLHTAFDTWRQHIVEKQKLGSRHVKGWTLEATPSK